MHRGNLHGGEARAVEHIEHEVHVARLSLTQGDIEVHREAAAGAEDKPAQGRPAFERDRPPEKALAPQVRTWHWNQPAVSTIPHPSTIVDAPAGDEESVGRAGSGDEGAGPTWRSATMAAACPAARPAPRRIQTQVRRE